MMFSLSVSASVVGEKSYTEPCYAMYAGYSGQEVTVSGFETIAYIATDMEASFMGITLEDLDKMKPDKQTSQFIYIVTRPEKLAVMQNSNFDRVSVSYQM